LSWLLPPRRRVHAAALSVLIRDRLLASWVRLLHLLLLRWGLILKRLEHFGWQLSPELSDLQLVQSIFLILLLDLQVEYIEFILERLNLRLLLLYLLFELLLFNLLLLLGLLQLVL
jgi:hypothetical protein